MLHEASGTNVNHHLTFNMADNQQTGYILPATETSTRGILPVETVAVLIVIFHGLDILVATVMFIRKGKTVQYKLCRIGFRGSRINFDGKGQDECRSLAFFR